MSNKPTYPVASIHIGKAAIVITRSGGEHIYLPDVMPAPLNEHVTGWLISSHGVTPASPVEGWQVIPLDDQNHRVIAARETMSEYHARIAARNAAWAAKEAEELRRRDVDLALEPIRRAAAETELCKWVGSMRAESRTSELSIHVDQDVDLHQAWDEPSVSYSAYLREKMIVPLPPTDDSDKNYGDCTGFGPKVEQVTMPDGEVVTVVTRCPSTPPSLPGGHTDLADRIRAATQTGA